MYEQMNPRPLSPFEESVVVINDRWLYFANHLVTGVTLASHPSVEPSGVQALKNPNPLKEVEG